MRAKVEQSHRDGANIDRILQLDPTVSDLATSTGIFDLPILGMFSQQQSRPWALHGQARKSSFPWAP